MSDFTIIKDSREKDGWSFSGTTVEVKALKTGDYTISGAEHLLVIERKKSVSELANNIGKERKRFEAELQRMLEFEYRYLILEFSMYDLLRFPYGSDIPKYLWKSIRIKPDYLLKQLIDYSLKYKVHVLFCGDAASAKRTAARIFKSVHEQLCQEPS